MTKQKNSLLVSPRTPLYKLTINTKTQTMIYHIKAIAGVYHLRALDVNKCLNLALLLLEVVTVSLFHSIIPFWFDAVSGYSHRSFSCLLYISGKKL